VDVTRADAGRARGFAVPLTVGVTLWLLATSVVPVVQVETGLDSSYAATALWAVAQPLSLVAAVVLVLVGLFRLLRALEVHLGAGRPGTSRPDAGRAADR